MIPLELLAAAPPPPPSKESLGKTLECDLVDPFAIFVQFILALVGLSSLVYKRQRERPRREVRVWLMDTSKQATGALLAHFLNVALSHLFGEFSRNNNDAAGACVWYLVNIAMDFFVGVFLAYLFVSVSQKFAMKYDWKDLQTGNYGDPPQMRPFVKQMGMWLFIVFMAKLVVAILILLLAEPLKTVAVGMLWPIEDSPHAKVVFVVLIIPLILNVFMFWIQDNFLMKQTHSAVPYTLLPDNEFRDL